MNTLRIPKLYCPLRGGINPNAERTKTHTNEWVRHYDLHKGADYEKYDADNFAYLTARFYPTARPDLLDLANDINVLLFVMDDAMDNQHDKADLITSRDNYIAFFDKCMYILTGGNSFFPPNPQTGVFAALYDVWKRLCLVSSVTWQKNFAQSIKKMLESGLWELDNVSKGLLPSIDEFYRRRAFLGAAHISTDLITVIEEIDLPPTILEYPSVLEATMLARNIVCWANDLFSFSKEDEHGDQHNMISIIMREAKLPLEEAINKTASIHNSDMRKFITISNEIPSFGHYDKDLLRYTKILGAILKGNIDWSENETARYSFKYV